MKIGHYDLDENGKLKPEIRDIVHLCADRNVALFFGHATHAEIYKLAEEVQKTGLKRAVIDHPFSPFLNVSPDMMKELRRSGISFNFTWDELSPLLGVDPQIMYNTIREVGVGTFHAFQRRRRTALPRLGRSDAPGARLHGSVRLESG